MRRTTIVVLGIALLAAVPASAGEPSQLPNLVPMPPFDLVMASADRDSGAEVALRLSTETQNLGAGHLDVLGPPPTDDPERAAALQCVAWQGRACTERTDVGDFEFHAEHGHWHIKDYAQYDLRRLTPQGEPDMSAAGLVRTGGKISFCLIDVNRTAEAKDFPEDPFGISGFYQGCTGVLQGISSGWSDIYTWTLDGQQIIIEGVPDGTYAVTITVNPERFLQESNYDDNTSFTTVELRGGNIRKPR